MPTPYSFPIACVGGSAGGLDAYIRLLKNMPVDTGAAIVVVNHIRNGPTYLPEILPTYTTMPVHRIVEDMAIEPNQVYVIPENRDLHVSEGLFHLAPISKPRGWPDVITVFLRSLTQCWDGTLIAIIVSGFDGDGAEALCGLQQIGGITIAQKQETAIQPDMPQSAIDSGCIDFILAPEEIGAKLAAIARDAGPPARTGERAGVGLP
jgi:chemotaxis response regulator CheB